MKQSIPCKEGQPEAMGPTDWERQPPDVLSTDDHTSFSFF